MDTIQNHEELSNQQSVKPMINGTDENSLWRIAKKRAFFKQFAIIYIVVCILLIAAWYVSDTNNYFWPKWLMFGWGLGVFIQYINAYHGAKLISKEKEYEKLQKQII